VARSLKKVEVKFRIFGFGPSDQQTLMRLNMFRGGDGGPAAIAWCFYYLLERFLKCGLAEIPSYAIVHPYSPNTNRKPPREVRDAMITLQTVVMDFEVGNEQPSVFQDTEEHYTLWDYRVRGCLAQDPAYELFTMHPKWLADTAKHELESMQGMSSIVAYWAGLLFERVGAMQINLNGSPLGEVLFGSAR
jgi:hypothetical protein